MTFDGIPIAMKCVYFRAATGFVFKTCYDEDFAKYSPGVQLIIDLTRHAINSPGLSFLDSCAAPDNSMIGHIWQERQLLKWYLIGSGSWLSRFWMQAFGLFRSLKSWLRR